LEPVIPAAWEGFSIDYRYRSTLYRIQVHQVAASHSRVLRLDGTTVPDDRIALCDDGREHRITLEHPCSS
jgi:cyclic beta-1,2-glucan synthetase